MPLVTVDLNAETHGRNAQRIADGVHRALVDAIGIPEADRFQIINKHRSEDLVFDRHYLARRDDIVYVRITLVAGRSEQQKRNLYEQVVANLAAASVRSGDVFVVLSENTRADWSVGNGEAQLLDMTS